MLAYWQWRNDVSILLTMRSVGMCECVYCMCVCVCLFSVPRLLRILTESTSVLKRTAPATSWR